VILVLSMIVLLGTISPARSLDIVPRLSTIPERWSMRDGCSSMASRCLRPLFGSLCGMRRAIADAPDATTTDEKGGFLVDPVPTMIAGYPVREAIVHARDRSPRSWIRTLLSPYQG